MYFKVCIVRLVDIIEGASFEFRISYFISLHLYCVNLSTNQLKKKKKIEFFFTFYSFPCLFLHIMILLVIFII
jgi:hypothetical protein